MVVVVVVVGGGGAAGGGVGALRAFVFFMPLNIPPASNPKVPPPRAPAVSPVRPPTSTPPRRPVQAAMGVDTSRRPAATAADMGELREAPVPCQWMERSKDRAQVTVKGVGVDEAALSRVVKHRRHSVHTVKGRVIDSATRAMPGSVWVGAPHL